MFAFFFDEMYTLSKTDSGNVKENLNLLDNGNYYVRNETFIMFL